jgi:hypothetical protein
MYNVVRYRGRFREAGKNQYWELMLFILLIATLLLLWHLKAKPTESAPGPPNLTINSILANLISTYVGSPVSSQTLKLNDHHHHEIVNSASTLLRLNFSTFQHSCSCHCLPKVLLKKPRCKSYSFSFVLLFQI